jgi:hypothetical protein
MLRTTPRRRYGRPFGPDPLFLADCALLDATALLSRSRGAIFPGDAVGCQDRSSQWTLKWTGGNNTERRTLALTVTATVQPFGGVRRWWRYPLCFRRCRVLAAVNPEVPVGCRLCLQARYVSDYPARDRRRRFVALFHALGRGSVDLDDDHELDALLARRRRGVRRGRRVRLRAIRSLMRLQARLEAVTGTVESGGL